MRHRYKLVNRQGHPCAKIVFFQQCVNCGVIQITTKEWVNNDHMQETVKYNVSGSILNKPGPCEPKKGKTEFFTEWEKVIKKIKF